LGWNESRKQEKIVEGITPVFEGIGIPAQATTVMIVELPREKWGSGGKLHTELSLQPPQPQTTRKNKTQTLTPKNQNKQQTRLNAQKSTGGYQNVSHKIQIHLFRCLSMRLLQKILIACLLF
jgi:phenylpyruvate tautomerase PptA (4-oxalocrotonate tautomerase family)